jgi:hypothetical protein
MQDGSAKNLFQHLLSIYHFVPQLCRSKVRKVWVSHGVASDLEATFRELASLSWGKIAGLSEEAGHKIESCAKADLFKRRRGHRQIAFTPVIESDRHRGRIAFPTLQRLPHADAIEAMRSHLSNLLAKVFRQQIIGHICCTTLTRLAIALLKSVVHEIEDTGTDHQNNLRN